MKVDLPPLNHLCREGNPSEDEIGTWIAYLGNIKSVLGIAGSNLKSIVQSQSASTKEDDRSPVGIAIQALNA